MASSDHLSAAMPTGNCFRCHQPGHWANECPLKTHPKPTAVAAASPPVIHCPCNGGACNVFTSKTEKNPNRRFYKCPLVPSCGFFKWCDQVSINSQPISVHPTCPCGSGPCRRVTVIDGPNAQRSYFVCCIKKSFGACGFFQWEDDAQIQPETEEASHGGSPCSTLIGYSGFDSADDENLLHETDLDSDESVIDYADTLPVNAVTKGKESIPVCSSFNNLKPVCDGVFASAEGIVPSFDLITVHEDAVRLETEEQVLPSLPLKHIEPQMEASCNGDPVLNGSNKPEPIHQHEHQSTTSGETGASISGSSSLVDLIEQYNSEKLHFESVSMKYVDVLTAYTGSYKKLESLRDIAHCLKKQLLEVENQVKLYEAKTSELAASLQEVSGNMVKSQKKMVETAGKVAKEVRVKQRDFVAP